MTFFSFFQIRILLLLSSQALKFLPRTSLPSRSYSVSLLLPVSFVVILMGRMSFSYLLNTNACIESFETRFNIPHDVNISYCHQGDIEDQRLPHVVFFP